MTRWYHSLIPGRMPLPLAWAFAVFGMAALLLWIATAIGSSIVIHIQAGDTVRFEQVRQSADSTTAHHFTIRGLDISFEVRPGADTNLGYKITPTEAGTYRAFDAARPDLGSISIVVEAATDPADVPMTYVLDEVRMLDEAIELRMGPTSYWGYPAEERVRTDEVEDITITINTGDTIEFPDGFTGSSSNNITHVLTIEGLGIDLNLDDGRFGSESPDGEPDADAPGGALDGYEITFNKPGQFVISDSAHPRGHGPARFVVAEGDGGRGRFIVTRAFVVEDTRFVLETSETEAQFGYAAGSRVVSRTTADQVIFLALLAGSAIAAPVIGWAKRRRWWLWGIFGFLGAFLGLGQVGFTSVTVMAAGLLAARPRPTPPDAEAEEAAEDKDEGPPDRPPDGPPDRPPDRPPDGPPGPPTQDQRTLPPATLARPRPERSRRRPRF